MLTKVRALTEDARVVSVQHKGGVDYTCLQIHLLQLLLVVGLRLLAPVADSPERVVVIKALLANPVALFVTPLLLLLLLTLLAIFGLYGRLLGGIDSHVLGLALDIIG